MKGIVYKLDRICDSFLDMTHGNFYSINEVFIPELGIAFNHQTIHRPRPKDKRYGGEYVKKLREIEIQPEDAKFLKEYFIAKDKLENIASKYLSKTKN